MSRRLTRVENRARTRSLLLEAAAEVFARKGFAGASVEDIAEAAGFSTGALYSNFASKDELFVELLTARSGERLAGAAVVVADRSGGVGEIRLALSRRLLDVAAEEVDLAALQAEFWLYAIRRPQFRARMVGQLRANREVLAAALAERADGPARPADVPFDDVATVVMALFQGLVQVRRIDPELVPEALYGEAVHWLFTGLHAPPRPPLDLTS
ncbi:TetR/AcrR family transcriptional regulator [Streptomyces sp. CA-111067]|uniref:TetR/AcrR family transcriptional regulator n=1 Tax=Streptomyces sp. CA-111067 TaxID=3240046 RepID=UPI003D957348